MGVTYSVLPYTESLKDDPKVHDWLKEDGVQIPDDAPLGRNPTPNELRSIVDKLQDHKITYNTVGIFWEVEIFYNQDQNVSVIVPFSGDENVEFDLSFRGDFKLIVFITSELAEICGTLLLFTNWEDPIVFIPKHLNNAQ